jgi:hypothetical protein
MRVLPIHYQFSSMGLRPTPFSMSPRLIIDYMSLRLSSCCCCCSASSCHAPGAFSGHPYQCRPAPSGKANWRGGGGVVEKARPLIYIYNVVALLAEGFLSLHDLCPMHLHGIKIMRVRQLRWTVRASLLVRGSPPSPALYPRSVESQTKVPSVAPQRGGRRPSFGMGPSPGQVASVTPGLSGTFSSLCSGTRCCSLLNGTCRRARDALLLHIVGWRR